MLQESMLLQSSELSKELCKTSLNMKAESPWNLPVLCISRHLAVSQKKRTFVRTVLVSVSQHTGTWNVKFGSWYFFKLVLWMIQVNTALRKGKYMKTMLWNERDRGRIYAIMPEFSLEVSGEPHKFFSQPTSRVKSSRNKHPTWMSGYIIRFPDIDKLIQIRDGYRYRIQG